NNNIASLIAQRNLSQNTYGLTRSIEKLSSGYRINRASDDAAGLSISEGLRGQIRGNKQAIGNIQDGINLLQIAESGLTVANDNLQRIRELCIQAANDTNGSVERSAILSEVNARLADISRIAKSTKFNNVSLLDGTAATTLLQVGANSTVSTNTIDVSGVLTDSKATTLGVNIAITGGAWSSTLIRSYLGLVDAALTGLLSRRSNIGALQNRLESTLENLTVMNENLQASESRIRDLDIAKESANLVKNQILQQASASVLSQANQIPQLALSLLR
ncbi:MAG TPA: flagellin, partial [Cyanobacteria bacterium UBA9579]|nr:flagellin [Cyanobacteria bacterium UBA9579]